MGVERALIVLEAMERGPSSDKPDVFVVQATPAARDACYRLAGELRNQGFVTLMDYDGRSMKSQMKQADREGAKFAILIGDDELARGVATVRTLATSEQKEVAMDQVSAALRSSA